MESELQEALDHWKANPFRRSDLPFEAAVRSLESDYPVVELRLQSAMRWTVRVLDSRLRDVRSTNPPNP